MKFLMVRFEASPSGVFGILKCEDKKFSCVTLERAYGDSYKTKVPSGVYKCVRGPHRLASGPLETFEVMNVPGHTGILFHVGNYNTDSNGCILLGRSKTELPSGQPIITQSRLTFTDFLDILEGVNEFELEVK